MCRLLRLLSVVLMAAAGLPAAAQRTGDIGGGRSGGDRGGGDRGSSAREYRAGGDRDGGMDRRGDADGRREDWNTDGRWRDDGQRGGREDWARDGRRRVPLPDEDFDRFPRRRWPGRFPYDSRSFGYFYYYPYVAAPPGYYDDSATASYSVVEPPKPVWVQGHFEEMPVTDVIEGEYVEVFHPAVYRRGEDGALELLEEARTTREPKVRIIMEKIWIEGHYESEPVQEPTGEPAGAAADGLAPAEIAPE
jgi:hypothetical protein